MTDEIPIQRGFRCTDCNSAVYLTRRENRTLAAECECSDRSIKVATVLPEGWS
jgi:hypothetical protein